MCNNICAAKSEVENIRGRIFVKLQQLSEKYNVLLEAYDDILNETWVLTSGTENDRREQHGDAEQEQVSC